MTDHCFTRIDLRQELANGFAAVTVDFQELNTEPVEPENVDAHPPEMRPGQIAFLCEQCCQIGSGIFYTSFIDRGRKGQEEHRGAAPEPSGGRQRGH